MPHTPREAKRLYEQLAARQHLPFDEVLAIFADKKGLPHRARTVALLNTLSIEEVFTLRGPDGKVVSWDDEAPWLEPTRYSLHFHGFDGLENFKAAQTVDALTEVTEVFPGYAWTCPQRRQELRIFGDLAGAAVLAERLRAFTQQFAFHLVTGQHAGIAGQFSRRAAQGQTLDTLLTHITKLEKTYGQFDFFDRVMVTMVFSPPFAPVKDKLLREGFPRDIPDAALRGHSTFEIISVRTPNGMRVHDMLVSLSIVEEDGVFRIADAQCHSGR